jgi:hypothetical protein
VGRENPEDLELIQFLDNWGIFVEFPQREWLLEMKAAFDSGRDRPLSAWDARDEVNLARLNTIAELVFEWFKTTQRKAVMQMSFALEEVTKKFGVNFAARAMFPRLEACGMSRNLVSIFNFQALEDATTSVIASVPNEDAMASFLTFHWRTICRYKQAHAGPLRVRAMQAVLDCGKRDLMAQSKLDDLIFKNWSEFLADACESEEEKGATVKKAILRDEKEEKEEEEEEGNQFVTCDGTWVYGCTMRRSGAIVSRLKPVDSIMAIAVEDEVTGCVDLPSCADWEEVCDTVTVSQLADEGIPFHVVGMVAARFPGKTGEEDATTIVLATVRGVEWWVHWTMFHESQSLAGSTWCGREATVDEIKGLVQVTQQTAGQGTLDGVCFAQFLTTPRLGSKSDTIWHYRVEAGKLVSSPWARRIDPMSSSLARDIAVLPAPHGGIFLGIAPSGEASVRYIRKGKEVELLSSRDADLKETLIHASQVVQKRVTISGTPVVIFMAVSRDQACCLKVPAGLIA